MAWKNIQFCALDILLLSTSFWLYLKRDKPKQYYSYNEYRAIDIFYYGVCYLPISDFDVLNKNVKCYRMCDYSAFLKCLKWSQENLALIHWFMSSNPMKVRKLWYRYCWYILICNFFNSKNMKIILLAHIHILTLLTWGFKIDIFI